MHQIRPVREDDAPSIVALLNPIIRAGTLTVMAREVTVDEQRGFIRVLPARGIYLAAACDRTGRVVGIQDVLPAADTGAGEISTFVALGAQRRGVGAALCAVMFREAAARGYARLVATIRADNPGAVAFYGRQGFEVVASAGGKVVAERHLAPPDAS